MKNLKAPSWRRPAAALVLALGLLAATGTQALAAPPIKCDNASWDNASWDCTATTGGKTKPPKPLSTQNASWDSLLTTTSTTGP